MQANRRVFAIIIIAAILLGAGVFLMATYGQDSGTSARTPISLLASTKSVTLMKPGSSERYCLSLGENEEQFLTRFWGMIANKTGVDDASAVLLDLSVTGYPGKIPHNMHFSFSSRKDWWSGSHKVFFFGDDEGACGCFWITQSRESPDISGEIVPSPGRLFGELEQIPFSYMGVDGKELFINTALGYGPPSGAGDKIFLLANGSVMPLHNVTFDQQGSLAYPWIIQIMECTGEPKECSSRPGVQVLSDTRLKDAGYRTG
jgi:hypothetical protein